MNLQGIVWGLDCFDLAQDRDMLPATESTVTNGRFTQNMEKGLTSLETVSL
jgi:hypothetical protein